MKKKIPPSSWNLVPFVEPTNIGTTMFGKPCTARKPYFQKVLEAERNSLVCLIQQILLPARQMFLMMASWDLYSR
ncbi:hypothetical protein SDJN03_27326, partial [Cucurbita argyrosperma subsp. sororia]